MTSDWRDWVIRFKNTCIWSWAGWRDSWATEMGLRQWSVVVAGSTALAFWCDFSVAETGLILLAGMVIIIAELLNTGIEKACDLVTTDTHPLAKKAKDASSAGVAVAALTGLAVWLLVLFG